jgi:hypothetical protein
MADEQTTKATAPKTTKTEPAEGRVVVRMYRGSYTGFGCPDTDKRIRKGEQGGPDDIGHAYTHEHPAQSVWEEKRERDANGNEKATYHYVTGELVQLYPLPEHEADAAREVAAKDKRSSFSHKEALKRARMMVDSDCARMVE